MRHATTAYGVLLSAFVSVAAIAQDTTTAPIAPPADAAPPAAEAPPAAPAPPAPPAPPGLPPGWAEDGSDYVHNESGLECSPKVGQYTRQRLEGPADFNVVGTCVYEDAKHRYAGVRVRRYQAGIGESTLALQNDEALMGESGRSIKEAFRVTPMTMPDGSTGQRLMITIVRRKFLVDCFSIADDADPTAAMSSVLKLCRA